MIGGLLPRTQPQKLRGAWLLIFSLGCVFCVRLMRSECTRVDTAGGLCPCELCWCVRGFNTLLEPQNHTFRLTPCPRGSEMSVCKQTLFTFILGTNSSSSRWLTILLLISWKWISHTFSTTSSFSNVTKPNPGVKEFVIRNRQQGFTLQLIVSSNKCCNSCLTHLTPPPTHPPPPSWPEGSLGKAGRLS